MGCLKVFEFNLVLFVEFRLYQWLRRNTVDRLTFKRVEYALDVDTEVAWQERQGVEIALSHYLDDMPSMSFIGCCTFVPTYVYSKHRLCPWTSGKWQVKDVVSHTSGQETVQ